jgi:hypothetical protein
MLEIAEDIVTFSRETWENLKQDIYFHELIEMIEDKEALLQAQKETEYFIDYDEYRNQRISKINV